MAPLLPARVRLHRALAGLAIVASLATLVVSLTMETVRFQKVLSPLETYSIYGGIEVLWEDGNFILASIVFLFSMVFPFVKLIALGVLWLRCGTPHARRETAHWLHLLGKWSMLDVYIIAVYVGAIQLGIAAGSSRPGIYLFSSAILMSMASTWIVAFLEPRGSERGVVTSPALRVWWARALTTASAALLVLGVLSALFLIRKGIFFNNEVRLPRTLSRMGREGELFLALMMGVFVVGASAARVLVLLRLRWLPGGSPTTLRLALRLDEWAMLDVFGLGLVIVWVKLDELATTTLGAGFWYLIAAAAVFELDAWAYRRAVQPNEAQSPSRS